MVLLIVFGSILFCLLWISSSSSSNNTLVSPLKPKPTHNSDVRKMKRIQEMQVKSPSLYLGRLGSMMVDMLDLDLPFTLFAPSESYFHSLLARQKPASRNQEEAILGSSVNLTQTAEDKEEVYAIVSRILGFSAVPKLIQAQAVPLGGEMELESISGYKLYLSKDANRGFLVNNLTWEVCEFKRGQLMVHLVSGVLMDSEFERSMIFEDNFEEDT
ncbi:hypothetical protein O6H91_02G038900 [Diphasiastrum complanatum]|nr:hypothetical protein O6H91_02G038900 [Diphasiastrum complanatum]